MTTTDQLVLCTSLTLNKSVTWRPEYAFVHQQKSSAIHLCQGMWRRCSTKGIKYKVFQALWISSLHSIKNRYKCSTLLLSPSSPVFPTVFNISTKQLASRRTSDRLGHLTLLRCIHTLLGAQGLLSSPWGYFGVCHLCSFQPFKTKMNRRRHIPRAVPAVVLNVLPPPPSHPQQRWLPTNTVGAEASSPEAAQAKFPWA